MHIAFRNKYTGMCEVLLSDPKNSKLLYRPNKAGETPYSIDSQNKPPILVGVFSESMWNRFFIYIHILFMC